jgi:hypothetical protein
MMSNGSDRQAFLAAALAADPQVVDAERTLFELRAREAREARTNSTRLAMRHRELSQQLAFCVSMYKFHNYLERRRVAREIEWRPIQHAGAMRFPRPDPLPPLRPRPPEGRNSDDL